MCRSIKILRVPQGEPPDEDVRAAALQFVRKVSGYRQPAKAREELFERCVDDVEAAIRRMFEGFAETPARGGARKSS